MLRMRAGSGMVHLSSPGTMVADAPAEVVQRPVPMVGWAAAVLDSLDRFHCLVVGPGLGRDDSTAAEARRLVVESPVPVVVDGDGLFAMAWNAQGAAVLAAQPHVTYRAHPPRRRVPAAHRWAAARRSPAWQRADSPPTRAASCC